jgi:hypothetical protein
VQPARAFGARVQKAARHGDVAVPEASIAARHCPLQATLPTKREQRATDDSGNRPARRFAPLTQHVELHLAVLSLDDIRPCQGDELVDAKASGVADLDQEANARSSWPSWVANLGSARHSWQRSLPNWRSRSAPPPRAWVCQRS